MLAQLSRLTDVGKKHTGPSTEFFKIVEFQAKNLKINTIKLVQSLKVRFAFDSCVFTIIGNIIKFLKTP